MTTLAGLTGHAGNADGNGTDARFSNPQGLAVDDAGNIYVADTGNNLVRKITPAGKVTTLQLAAGANDAAGKTGGNIQLNNPGGVAVDGAGNIYVADTGNQCVRKIAFPPNSTP